MRLGVFLLVVALGAAGACSNDTFTGDDGGPDTGNDVGPIGGGDGSTDGAQPDGAVEAGPKRFCDTQDAQFCADFDIPGDAGAGFEPAWLDGGWGLDFQSTLASSSPDAVEVDVTSGPGSAFIQNRHLAVPNYVDASPTNRIVIEADVYLPTPVFTPDPVFVFYGGSAPVLGMQFGLAMHTGVYKLAAWPGGGGSIIGTLSPQPDTNKWVHAILSVDLNASGGTISLDIGSAHASGNRPTEPDSGALVPGALGVGSSDPYATTNAFKFYVDNVTAHWN